MIEVLAFISAQGWTPQTKTRRNGIEYLYAAQRSGKRILWKYIAPLSKVEQLTTQDIIKQLEKERKK